MSNPVPEAAQCGACGEQQVRIREAEVDADGEGTERVPTCTACGHQPSMQVYREARLDALLPDREDWPSESGVEFSENLPETPEGEDAAVLLVLGPREWTSLGKRASLTFRREVEVEVRKGRSPGVGFTHDSGTVAGVQVDLPGEAVKELHQTGHWGASVGPSLAPVHLRVVVLADA